MRAYREFAYSESKVVFCFLQTFGVVTTPVQTAECERSLSRTKLRTSPQHASLLIDYLLTLLFINTVRTPLSKFNAEEFVNTWFQSDIRCAEN